MLCCFCTPSIYAPPGLWPSWTHGQGHLGRDPLGTRHISMQHFVNLFGFHIHVRVCISKNTTHTDHECAFQTAHTKVRAINVHMHII